MVMTAHELELLWDERQTRYGMRRTSAGQKYILTDSEVSSIVAYRRLECEMLTPKEKTTALVALAQWQPPTAR